jgi:hypothetical protein
LIKWLPFLAGVSGTGGGAKENVYNNNVIVSKIRIVRNLLYNVSCTLIAVSFGFNVV